jgi:pyruvate,water dikinase
VSSHAAQAFLSISAPRQDRLPAPARPAARTNNMRLTLDPAGPTLAAGGSPINYCRPLTRLRAGDKPRFGGKAASLGELLAAGIPVPPGFAIAVGAFESFVRQSGLQATIRRQLSDCGSEDLDALSAASEAIAAAFETAAVPPEMADEIAGAYADLGRPAVAVRSSALGEDTATATFAGQQETFLWVSGEERVLAAARACWASLYTPRAVSYRANRGDPADLPAMGVVVQQMIDARVSGVMFTCSPTTGDPSTIAVNASWGLGEAIVSGEVNPDELLISKVTGEVIREAIGEKHVERIAAPAGGGTIAREVEADRRRARCLTEEEVQALVELAKLIERHFGAHQDVEWAIAPSGELFAVQSRPVTSSAKRAAPSPPEPASAISLVMSRFGVKS